MTPPRNLLALIALAFSIASASAATFTADTTVGTGDTSYDSQDIVVNGCRLTVDGPHAFASLHVINGGEVTHSPWALELTNNRLELTVAGDVSVADTSAIRGNAAIAVLGTLTIGAQATLSSVGRGYPIGADDGPGVGGHSPWRGGGGGHGGFGGQGSSEAGPAPGGVAYGDPLRPVAMGSRGGIGSYGPGGPGGGAVRLQVGGTLALDGLITADGGGVGDTRSGGGAGGSIWISAKAVSGGGAITANGGNGNYVYGGGGSGGRVAVWAGSVALAGPITATGGNGAQRGAAGTVFLDSTQTHAALSVGNGGVLGAITPLDVTSGVSTLRIEQGAVAISEADLVVANLILGTNGVLTHRAAESGVSVTVAQEVTVDAGGRILADGLGYSSATNAGPGAGGFLQLPNGLWSAGGAGHGGLGANGYTGAGGGLAYGSIATPTNYGSLGGGGFEGPGGAGGGAIRLRVGERLTVNGSVTANGQRGLANNSGGGSGGSIWLTVGLLAGNGIIAADGGAGESVDGGGGGGGRIAIDCASNSFAGTLTANGGGARQAGPGTVYLRQRGDDFGAVQLAGPGTGSYGPATPLVAAEPLHLSLSNFALVTFPQPVTLASLTVGPNGWVTVPSNGVPLDLVVLGGATIAAGGQLDVDGLGYPIGADSGPGAGTVTDHGGSGGGHGGGGGMSWTGARGGRAYGSTFEPVTFGSQGGPSLEGNGGAGGGAVRLTVGGTLTLDGRLSASGANAVANNAGGGAGGSIFLAVGDLVGAGSPWARGGAGEFHEGGGGGGGRIAIYGNLAGFDTNNISVAAGGGSQAGTNGTLHLGAHPAPRVVGHWPSSYVTEAPDHFEVEFDQGIDPASFTPDHVQVTVSSGTIPPAEVSVVNIGARRWGVGFPRQTSNGTVSFIIAPGVRSLFGLESVSAYAGSFEIRLENYLFVTRTGDTLRLEWATSPGHTYQLESASALSGWSDRGHAWSGTGGILGTNIPLNPESAEFFRLESSTSQTGRE